MPTMTVSELGRMAQMMAVPIFLTFVALVVLLSDLIFNRDDERRWPAYLTMAGLLGALFLWVQSWLMFHDPATRPDNAFFALMRRLLRISPQADTGAGTALFGGMFDPVGLSDITLLATLLILVVAMIVTMMAPPYLERRGIQRGEFYALLLFAVVGLIAMAGSQHLIMLFLGLELLSIPLYILAGFARPALRSQEAALKYFLLGAFSSSIFLYGIALVYGATGSMQFQAIGGALQEAQFSVGQQAADNALQVAGLPNLMLIAGLTMLIVGMGFKIAAAPFHQWTPDVYEGAPTPVTAFMVAGTKIGGFVALVNILYTFGPLYIWWGPLLSIIALLTMLVGNIGAILQTNIKRMLAYSSIAHAGYMLVGLAGLSGIGILPSLFLYLSVYALMNLGAFAVLHALDQREGQEIIELEQFKGLARRYPVLSLLLGFFLLSLAGFPPTAGFFAKFFLFTGSLVGRQVWLIVAAVLLSVVSVFYYARFIVAMFMQEQPSAAMAVEGEEVEQALTPVRPALSWMVGTALVVTALLVLALGLYPTPLLSLTQ